jgi:tellurite resistance protein TehA-like permease
VTTLTPAFGILGILYAVFTIVLAGLAVYALVLAIIFLRLRIAELKRAARPKSEPLE